MRYWRVYNAMGSFVDVPAWNAEQAPKVAWRKHRLFGIRVQPIGYCKM